MRSLQRIFADALKLSAPMALAGCGALPPDTTGYSSPVCSEGSSYPSLAGLTPSVVPDVIELRTANISGQMRLAATTVSKTGTACATATDISACKAAFMALAPTTGFGGSCTDGCFEYYLATTTGNTVRAWASLAELKAFLGTIDTGQEAALLTLANGYSVSCTDLTQGGIKKTASGFDVIAAQGFACGEGTKRTRHFISISSDGTFNEKGSEVIAYGSRDCAVGRRPEGLASRVEQGFEAVSRLGKFFAEIQHLEAASVNAFEQLGRDLVLANAPVELIARAEQSRLDEVRHAEATAQLATRFGARTTAPVVNENQVKDLYTLALDNAAEGCVRETFGALVAHHQAAFAADPEVKAAMVTIAADETRHAELSWEIDAWAQTRLTDEQRDVVRAVRADALASLRRSIEREADLVELCVDAGMPTKATALQLLGVLEAELYAEA